MDKIKYNIIPTIDQGYTPDVCAFHLQEDEEWSGVDGSGTERTWTYHIEQATMKDGAGAVIGTLGSANDGKTGAPVSAGDKDSLTWNSKLLSGLVITHEAQGHPEITSSSPLARRAGRYLMSKAPLVVRLMDGPPIIAPP